METFWKKELNKEKEFECIENDISVNVCIIGGGLTGLSLRILFE